jgi:hypothetical protein
MTHKETSEVRTIGASGADSWTSKQINGKILALKFYVDASIDVKAVTSGCPVPEYVFGTSEAAITVASSAVYYPVIESVLGSTGSTGSAANKTNVFVQMAISGTITFTVTGTNTKLWQVEIIYED